MHLKCCLQNVCIFFRPQCINLFWPCDAIWRHRSGSTLAKVMACCLMAPSHHLNQCGFLISEVLWHSPDSNFTASAQAKSNLYHEFEIILLKLLPHLPGANELNTTKWNFETCLSQVQLTGRIPNTVWNHWKVNWGHSHKQLGSLLLKTSNRRGSKIFAKTKWQFPLYHPRLP